MEQWFQRKEQVPKKCESCTIHKKNSCIYKSEELSYFKKGKSKDILIVLEMPERENFIPKFLNLLEKQKLFTEFDYEIVYGLQCAPKGHEISSPVYKTYKNCNLITEDRYKDFKVILTIGRAITTITQSSDIGSWKEFSEFLFNPTYFYTGFEWKNKIRVYPIPIISEWMGIDNFNNFFVKKQFEFIYKFLRNYSKFEFVPYNIEVSKNPNEYLESNLSSQTIAWDIETNSLDMFKSDFKIGCISISKDGNEGYVLDFGSINKRLLSQYFSNKYQISANGKFDCKSLLKSRIINCKVDEDVTLLSHILSTEKNTNSLKTLAWQIGFGGYDKELEEYIEKNNINNFLDVPQDILFSYAGRDAIVTFRSFQYLMKIKETQPQLYNIYKKVLIGVIPVFTELELEGMILNFDYVNKLNRDLKEASKELEEKIYKLLGKKIKLNSSEQLARILEETNFPCHGRSKKKFWTDNKGEQHYFYSVGEEPLKAWKTEGYEIATLLLKLREQSKLMDTFVGSYSEDEKEEKDVEDLFFVAEEEENKEGKEKGIVKYLCEDKKLHPTFNPGRTNTLRSSCHNPNLQQMPHAGDVGKLFRPIFKCPEGYLIGEADQSGFQLRIAAIYSQDEAMRDVFLNKSGDLHSLSARNIFCKNLTLDEFLKVKNEEPYATFRFKAKNQINFPLLFSSSPYVIYNTIKQEWKEEEIDIYIKENNLELIESRDGGCDKILTVVTSLRNKFFETYYGLAKWIEEQHTIAIKQGYIDSYHGIRRHLPQLFHMGTSYDRDEMRNLMNISVNSPVQSFEAFVIYEVMIKVYKRFREEKLLSKMVAMIHDSIVFYIHKNEIEKVYNIIEECMNDSETYSIPLSGELKIGKIWGYGNEISSKNINNFLE